MARKRNRNRNAGGNGGNGGSDVLARARRDVMQTLHPYLQELHRTGRQATRDTNQQVTQLGNVNSALTSQLAGLNQPFQDTLSGIGTDLSSQIAGLSGMLTQTAGAVPASEQAAGANLVGVTGAGGLENISSARTRGASYNTSAQRQGAIETKVDSRNALNDLANFNRDLGSRRTDIMQGAPAQIRSRMDELRQQQLDRYLALQSLALNRSTDSLNWTSFNHGVAMDAQDQQDYQAWLAYKRNHTGGTP